MNKMLLVGALSVLVSGCTTVPQAPKDATEMAAFGEDNLLNVPVDISSFKPSKLEITSEEDKNACFGLFCSAFGRDGDKGIITVFTDPNTGKAYDEDGQPVTEKGERILKNGYVCKVRLINSNIRGYGPVKMGLFSNEFSHDDCRTLRSKNYTNNATTRVNTLVAVGVLSGAVIAGAAIAAGTSVMSLIEKDTM